MTFLTHKPLATSALLSLLAVLLSARAVADEQENDGAPLDNLTPAAVLRSATDVSTEIADKPAEIASSDGSLTETTKAAEGITENIPTAGAQTGAEQKAEDLPLADTVGASRKTEDDIPPADTFTASRKTEDDIPPADTFTASRKTEDDIPPADTITASRKTEDDKPPADTSTASRKTEDDIPPADTITASRNTENDIPLADAVSVAEEVNEVSESIQLLKARIPPGTYQRLSWSATELFEGIPVSTPVLVVNGRSPGPTLCLTAAVHGDELNGIEVVRRVMHNIEPAKLSGAVIGVPIVNLQGFRRGSRYLPDRRDLNRFFPGNPSGSAASRIAHSFFNEIVSHCDALVDLHTGSFERSNLPQLRADLTHPDVRTLTLGFGATVVLHSSPASGTLRGAATSAGIPAVTLEAGGPSVLELDEVKHSVKGILTLLNTLGMLKKTRLWGDPEPIYYRSTWVRANRGGILLVDVKLGARVQRGDLLGTITDPMNNASTRVYSPYSGRIIGMARNQVVMPGFAAFHLGIEAADDVIAEAAIDAIGNNSVSVELDIDDYVDGMSE